MGLAAASTQTIRLLSRHVGAVRAVRLGHAKISINFTVDANKNDTSRQAHVYLAKKL